MFQRAIPLAEARIRPDKPCGGTTPRDVAALWAIVAGLSLAVLIGCGSGEPAEDEPTELERLGELPGLQAARDPVLIDEYARVKEQEGTPAQLERTGVKDGENIAASFVDLFPDDLLGSLLSQTESVFPPGDFEFDSHRLRQAAGLRHRHDRQRQFVRKALADPECDLGIRYTAGYAADTSVIDVVRVACRLEAFLAAEKMAEGDLSGAIDALEAMFQLTHCLAATPHLDARMHGAYLRGDTFRVIAALLQHELLRREHVEQLAKLVRHQLDTWPEDATAWIGERALGLHAYEMIRAGQGQDLLTIEELEALQRRQLGKSVSEYLKENVDADQAFYMTNMRRVIELCDKPFHERLSELEKINQAASTSDPASGPPHPAARLLMKDLLPGQINQARDRANTEAWALGLAAAIGAPRPPYRVNPLTGRPYEVRGEEGMVVVTNSRSGSGGGTLGHEPMRIWVPILRGQ